MWESALSFSPDSRWVAFSSSDDMSGLNLGNQRVYLRRVDDAAGEWRKLGTGFDGDVRVGFWSADGRTIYFNSGLRATTQVFALDVRSGAVRQLTDVKGIVSAEQDPATRRVLVRYSDPATPSTVYAVPDAGRIGDRRRWTQLTDLYPEVSGLALGQTEEITWTSADGTPVGGVLVKPVGYEPGRRYPLMVVLHGGPHSAEVLEFNGDGDGAQVYAGAGYVVLAPNYRGSTNYGERFKLGVMGDYFGHPFRDVMSGVDHLVAQGLVDSTRMGVLGHSAGGTLANWILTHTDRFRAISSGAGVSNWVSMYATSDFQRPRELWFGDRTPYQDFEAYWSQSPIRYVGNAKTPTLIYATQGDPRVPSGQALELFTALRRLGVPTELYMYPGDQHGTPGPRNRLHNGMAEMAWMDYHVRGSGRPFAWRDVLATLPEEKPPTP